MQSIQDLLQLLFIEWYLYRVPSVQISEPYIPEALYVRGHVTGAIRFQRKFLLCAIRGRYVLIFSSSRFLEMKNIR